VTQAAMAPEMIDVKDRRIRRWRLDMIMRLL